MHDTHGMFTSLRTAFGPRTNAIAPIKSDDGMTLHTDHKRSDRDGKTTSSTY